jgi:colanic acid biosynthesis protein WcaH
MSNHQSACAREPRPGEWMAPQDFENVIRLTPLVAIDFIIRSPHGKVLIGRRTNEPARGVFFVPGGRITKNEARSAAFRRISQEELGIELDIAQARFHSVNDHFYQTNRFFKPGFGTHYVTLAYELTLALEISSLPKDQHGEFEWMSPTELLRSHEVHDNTKAYFR